MSENPRRWYQFKLSTILVLVAILAWGMSMRPWWISGVAAWRSISMEEYGRMFHQQVVAKSPPEWWNLRKPIECIRTPLTGYPSVRPGYYAEEPGVNPQMLWPLLALAAFLTWKWIEAKWKRRREKPVAT